MNQKLAISTESDFKPYELLHKLIRNNVTGIDRDDTGPIVFEISNKYYQASITIEFIEKKLFESSTFKNDLSIEAFVYYIDKNFPQASNQQLQRLDEVKKMFCSPKIQNMETKILLGPLKAYSNLYDDLVIWAVQNGVQYIEMNDEKYITNKDKKPADDECSGFEQFVEALHTHRWPHIDFIHDKPINKQISPSVTKYPTIDSSIDSLKVLQEFESSSLIGDILGTVQRDGMDQELSKNLDSLTFEEIYQKFDFFKDKSKELPWDQRKIFAEKVTLSLWKAIEGDESEIDGLSDSSESAASASPN